MIKIHFFKKDFFSLAVNVLLNIHPLCLQEEFSNTGQWEFKGCVRNPTPIRGPYLGASV